MSAVAGVTDRVVQPSRARMVFAALLVLLVVLAVWKLIEYRTQPPPPPNPIGARSFP
ncbi:MAG: hypothetical protein ABR589_11970 [Chthoniobacterales bacterium]